METQTPESPATTVDASRPFRSVKEAVAIFGDRLLPRETHSPSKLPSVSLEKEIVEEPYTFTQNKISHSAEITPSIVGNEIVEYPLPNEPIPSPQNLELTKHRNIVHGNDLVMMLMVLKKLEAEVQDTKKELRNLEKRESETEVALAELHKNMSKIAMAEADEEMEKSREIATREEERSSSRGGDDIVVKNMDSPTLAKILSMSDYEGYFREDKRAKTKKMKMKKKPIIPLVTDIFSWKKKPSSSPNHSLSGSLFSSHMYF